MKKYIAFVAIFLAACNNKTVEKKEETAMDSNMVTLTDTQAKNAGIETGKAEQRNISSILRANGFIDVPPQNMVSVSVPLGGYLKSTKLLEGMHVRKGETIAIMEDQQYISLQQEFLTASARLSYIEEEFHRQQELNQSKAASDKAFQQAKADYITQKVLVKSLNEKLQLIGINPDILNENTISRNIRIVSPIDGYVSKVNVNIGKYVNPSDILFELVNPSDIHLALNIFEKDIDKLFIGQRVMAYTNNDSKKYPCEIILIGKDLSNDRSVQVHCHFEKYDASLIPGMFMNADIEAQTKNVYTLPGDAVVRFEGKEYVFEVSGNMQYAMTEVTATGTESDIVQISFADNNNRGESTFVTKGAYSLLMKMKNTEED